MRVAAVQCPVLMDIGANLRALEAAVSPLAPGALVVAPEGLLSGYLPEPGFVERLDADATVAAIEYAARLATQTGLHLVAGACLQVDGVWRNASLYFGPDGRRLRYDKINLAVSERGDFSAGDTLPVFDIAVEGQPVALAIQMCREIRYPEQWRWLAAQGAQVIAYVNNAIGAANGPDLWRAHAISRAAETQRFVVGANNAGPDQTCPTLIVSPAGRVLAEAPMGETCAISAEIDLAEVSDWVIGQARGDVVEVAAKR